MVAVPGRTVVSVEALLRWEDDVLGPLSPVEVVDVAEGAGLAAALGEHVMALALHDAAVWWGEGHAVPVMVNLSAQQVCQTALVGSVTGLLARTGLPGGALVVEVTETAVLEDAELAATVLEQVRRLGAAVYLDDFGSGWSSLERMGELPLDGIKLDRTFVARSGTRPGLAAVRSAVALARSLQVPLVVEGVETLEQAQVVADAGADRAQGYLYSRPVPLARLLADVLGGPRGLGRPRTSVPPPAGVLTLRPRGRGVPTCLARRPRRSAAGRLPQHPVEDVAQPRRGRAGVRRRLLVPRGHVQVRADHEHAAVVGLAQVRPHAVRVLDLLAGPDHDDPVGQPAGRRRRRPRPRPRPRRRCRSAA